MNITLNCKVSLSKKLRSLVGNSGNLVLTVENLVEGRGRGRISLSSDENVDVGAALEIGETSIMITPTDITEGIPSNNHPVATIFSTLPTKQEVSSEGVVRKIATVQPPETDEIPEAVVPASEVPTPAPFVELDEPECKEYIKDLSGLMEAVATAKTKVSNVSLEGVDDPREKAILLAEKEAQESLGVPAHIILDNCAALTLNDLGIALTKGMPFDLSNVSARKIAASSNLKEALKSGFVKFIAPEVQASYAEGAMLELDGGTTNYDVYDRPDAAGNRSAVDGPSQIIDGPNPAQSAAPKRTANAVASRKEVKEAVIDESAMEITADDMEAPTEEQSIINLTGVGTVPSATRTSSVVANKRKSSHGNRPNRTLEISEETQIHNPSGNGDSDGEHTTVRRLS